MPQRIEKKNKCYKNKVINVCSEECSWTSAEAQDWNQSLALSQITPQNSELISKFVNHPEEEEKTAVV